MSDNDVAGEPHNRYLVQKRYNPAPPAPYENPWRTTWSWGQINDALQCAKDERDEHAALVAENPKRVGYDFRVYDTVSQNEVQLGRAD